MKENFQDKNISQRIVDTEKLLEDFSLNKDAEYFTPARRLEFMGTIHTHDFLSLLHHVNARLRSQEPRERNNLRDQGSYLGTLGTPVGKEQKRLAFEHGFYAIQHYIDVSADHTDYKIEGVAMATEALIIWTHMFNDGNGRTGRFIAKFIESGTTDPDALITETVDNNVRQKEYPMHMRVDTYNTVKDIDLLWDDGELEAIRARSEMPVAEGIQTTMYGILGNDKFREIARQRHKELVAWKEKLSAANGG